jgi:hypothetical protein
MSEATLLITFPLVNVRVILSDWAEGS